MAWYIFFMSASIFNAFQQIGTPEAGFLALAMSWGAAYAMTKGSREIPAVWFVLAVPLIALSMTKPNAPFVNLCLFIGAIHAAFLYRIFTKPDMPPRWPDAKKIDAAGTVP